ncbi:hypothetical protein BVRB_1g022540 [Beta vulgaris subsp. vulgaris]|nr:hypothetical protein BVRB_1g022540 [Beta vulgaris subsp. vulgaris]
MQKNTKGASYQIAITVKPAFSNGFNAANQNLEYDFVY